MIACPPGCAPQAVTYGDGMLLMVAILLSARGAVACMHDFFRLVD